MKKSTIKQINQDMKLRSVKLKVKSIKTHSNFANEIQSLEKSDKFFDRILMVTYVILAVLAITLIIVNIK